jgi:hypothetical protein
MGMPGGVSSRKSFPAKSMAALLELLVQDVCKGLDGRKIEKSFIYLQGISFVRSDKLLNSAINTNVGN